MAQIPQINNPITAKNYNYSSRPMDENTEPFDIVKLTGVGGAGGSSDAGTRAKLEMGNRELIPLSVQIAKDPTPCGGDPQRSPQCRGAESGSDYGPY